MSSNTSNYIEFTKLDGKVFIRYIPQGHTNNEGDITVANITSQRGLIVREFDNKPYKKK